MRVGIYLDLRNPPEWRRPWPEHYAESLESVEEAERIGLDSVWLSEHHFFEDGYLSQPMTFAAAIAARTRRIRIGTAVLLAPLRSAVQIAEDATLVDVLSAGRLDLGLGAGYRAPEFTAFGADRRDRMQVTLRRIEEVRDRLSAEGASPPPVQSPIPLWAGFMGPLGAQRAGRLGTGLLALGADLRAPYLAGLREGGHPPEAARMAGPVHFVLNDDPEAAWKRLAPHFEYQWNSYHRYAAEGAPEAVAPPLIDLERWRRPGASGAPPRIGVLTPEEAERVLRGWLAGSPTEEVFFWARVPGMPDDLARRHLELLGTALRPALASFEPAHPVGEPASNRQIHANCV